MRICNEILGGLTSLCKKCDDIISCAGSGHHLRPDRIEPGAQYFKSPCQYVRCHCLKFFGDVCFQGVYGLWFVLVNCPFQKSPQEIIRRCQIGRARWPKSLRNEAVTEKGVDFGHAGVRSVGCRSILPKIRN